MRVFVTGASGFVGSAVVQELLKAGHQVLGLARSAASAKALEAAGAEVHRGDLEDLESLRQGALQADGVIHTGFIHDFSRFKECCETDRGVITALGEVLAGTGKPLVVTSGTALLAGLPLAKEDDMPVAASTAVPRIASEEAAAALASRGVNISVVRLPPSVHGDGDHGFVPMIAAMAKEKGRSAYIGDGQNRWPAVHRLDAAKVYRLALERNAADARYHAIGDDGVPFRQIAEVIGKQLDLPVVSLSGNDAAAHFTWFQHFASIDNPVSSAQTRELLQWAPDQISLMEDIDRPAYF
ncbi:MAG: SDR family oxidoreductase, partial [Sphingobacteriales bacterium]